MPSAVTPIDPRGPRLNQAVLASVLLGGFVLDWRWVIPTWAVVLGLGAVLGARYGPVLRIYKQLVAPRLGSPTHLEDPRPPRFAATVGTVFLALATVALLAGSPAVAWGLALVVAALAALAAATGLCIGCEIWLLAARHRDIKVVA